MNERPDFNLRAETNDTLCTIRIQGVCVEPLKGVYLSPQIALAWSCVGAGFLGVIGNILTVLVYVKLGYREAINASYTALAVSDLCCSLATVT